MKKFIKKTSLFFGIPLCILFMLYVLTDPFKVIYKFNTKYISNINREYTSFELFTINYPRYKYNSFILSSSRGCGINTYLWKSFLPYGSSPYLFQSWSESITGIHQKVRYLDNNNIKLDNVLVLIDIPGSFSVQEPSTVLGKKHYMLSNSSKYSYHLSFFYSFLKPSLVVNSLKELVSDHPVEISIDTLTNDWDKNNKFTWNMKPMQDTSVYMANFIPLKYNIMNSDLPLINDNYFNLLVDIKDIFIKHNTKYKIVITPDYTHVSITKSDLYKLYNIFGVNNVFNYSGFNYLTVDKYNFTDVNHFDKVVGWEILNNIYFRNNNQNINNGFVFNYTK